MNFILLAWGGVWLSLYFGGPRATTQTLHPALVRYSKLLGISFFVFYFFLFNHIGAVTTLPAFFTKVNYLAYILIATGSLTMIIARHTLRNLSYTEVMSALNPITSPHKIYKITAHPMYLGMILIIIGSLFVFPNYFALATTGVIIFCIYKKAKIENIHHRTH